MSKDDKIIPGPWTEPPPEPPCIDPEACPEPRGVPTLLPRPSPEMKHCLFYTLQRWFTLTIILNRDSIPSETWRTVWIWFIGG